MLKKFFLFAVFLLCAGRLFAQTTPSTYNFTLANGVWSPQRSGALLAAGRN